MISSVLITGDAGGLNYIDETLTNAPKSAFNFCCSCAPDTSGETYMYTPKPQKKKFTPFAWTAAIINHFTKIELMRKPEYLSKKNKGK